MVNSTLRTGMNMTAGAFMLYAILSLADVFAQPMQALITAAIMFVVGALFIVGANYFFGESPVDDLVVSMTAGGLFGLWLAMLAVVLASGLGTVPLALSFVIFAIGVLVLVIRERLIGYMGIPSSSITG